MQQLDIPASIFALVEFATEGLALPKYLGAGFFVDGDGTFLTAAHVIADVRGIVVAVQVEHAGERGERPIVTPVSGLAAAADVDLARGKVESSSVVPIPIAEDPPQAGADVLTVEWSRSWKVEGEGLGIDNPSIHKGHIVRAMSWEDPPFKRKTQVYELSYPALLGASGAPVIDMSDLTVVGVLVANVATHLIPAQIDRIVDDTGETNEETRYYLPRGLAIAYSEFGAILPTSAS